MIQIRPRRGIGTSAGSARFSAATGTRPLSRLAVPSRSAQPAAIRLTRPASGVNIHLPDFNDQGRSAVANHLTPSELAEELHMKRQEVIGKCVEMGIPIFHGRIDKTLFQTSMRSMPRQAQRHEARAG